GAMRSRLAQRIASLGLTDKVALAGHVPQIEPYLAESDALLITSQYEGGPAVAVEALAQGLAVVSTDCSVLLLEFIPGPAAGRIVASRDPRALAAALTQVVSEPRTPQVLQALA